MQEVSGQKNKKWDAEEEDIDIGEELPADDFPPVEIEKDPAGAGGGSSYSGSSSSSGDESSSSTGNIPFLWSPNSLITSLHLRERW